MALFAQQGEIIYVDFEPDSTQSFHSKVDIEPPVYLDMDQDGVNEWFIQGRESFHQTISLWFQWNRFMVPYSATDTMTPKYCTPYPFILQLGDTLANLRYTTPDIPQYGRNPYSDPPGAGYYPPHYAGTRVEKDGDYYYGWLELSVNISDDAHTIDLVVYRMAYCTIPNYPLRAGQTSLDWSVEDHKERVFATVRPNPADDIVTITGERLKTATLINPLGQQIATAFCEGEGVSFDLSAQPAGIYLVRITDERGAQCVKKVVKQ